MSKEIFIRIDDSKQWNNTKVLWDYLRTLGNGKYKITISKADKRAFSKIIGSIPCCLLLKMV